MRPWNAAHWKLGPSRWAKGPLKTVRMSAMLYTHTAEPLNTELRSRQKVSALTWLQGAL